MRFAIGFVLALGLCGAAAAEDKAPAFEMSSGTFNAPLPDGYCVPTGAMEGLFATLATADKVNKTDISFTACTDLANGTITSWGMIKTPVALQEGHLGPRAAMLATVKATLETDAGKKSLNITDNDIDTKTNLREMFGKDFKGTTKIEQLGSDDKAIYFGGVANYDNGKGTTQTVACAYAMTIVRENAFAIIIYKQFESADDIAALLVKVKPAVTAFIAANES